MSLHQKLLFLLFNTLKVMKLDLKHLGYIFQFSKLDAQNFLLTQRRTRVYGLGDLDEGQDVERFRDDMKATLSSLSSDIRFPCKDVFDQNLPKTTLQGNAAMKVREAVEKLRSMLYKANQTTFSWILRPHPKDHLNVLLGSA